MIFKIISLLRKIQNLIYANLIKSAFKSAGTHFKVEYPIRIIGSNRISIGKNFNCFERNRIEAYNEHNGHYYDAEIIIGDNVSMNNDCHIGCVNKIVIGNDVLIASRVFITDHFHGDINLDSLQTPPSKRKVISKGSVTIGDGVWIGEGVCIMPNVNIGENCIIGANAVVTKSFPANSIIGGIPAKIIKRV